MRDWIFHQFYNYNFLMIFTLIGYHKWNIKRMRKNGTKYDF